MEGFFLPSNRKQLAAVLKDKRICFNKLIIFWVGLFGVFFFPKMNKLVGISFLLSSSSRKCS